MNLFNEEIQRFLKRESVEFVLKSNPGEML